MQPLAQHADRLGGQVCRYSLSIADNDDSRAGAVTICRGSGRPGRETHRCMVDTVPAAGDSLASWL